MSAGHEPSRKRRPHKMYLIATDLKVQDQLDGTIRLQRGFMCQEQDRSRGDSLWVKVLDNDVMLKLERRFLHEVPAELSGLLEPVSDPLDRLRLLGNPGKLQQLAHLPVDTPLWAQIGRQDELSEAELKYVGPLSRGSSAVLFGVQLKGSAAGRGSGNGSYKGHRLFSCPDGSAAFLPVSHVRLRHWSRSNGSDERHRDPAPQRSSNGLPGRHGNALPRAADSAPVTAQNQIQVRGGAGPFHLGQRVCFPLEDAVHRGEVRFCGALPGRASAGTYVGVLLDAPVGSWDGFYRGEKLCHIPSLPYGQLLPAAKVSAEPKPVRHNPPLPAPKVILKQAPPPATKPAPLSPSGSAPKVPLMPPKAAGKPPPLPPPKPAPKPLPPPVPPPKPTNSLQDGAPSPPRSLDDGEDREDREDGEDGGDGEVGEDGGDGGDSELEVGSMVEVNDPPLFGVIRWIGRISGVSQQVAGIELDQEISAGTDGSYLGERHFRCPANKGLFVKLQNCRRDSRFPAPETPVNQVERCNSVAFAEWGSERVDEDTPPVDGDEAGDFYQGWKRGIQGHLNSCYLDATLFSLFSCCSSADWILFWSLDSEPDQNPSRAQDLLRCEIVNPLRRFGYVCASKTMSLRRLLQDADGDAGFTSQEKDPEEFLNKLFQLLRVEPLLKIRSLTQQPQQCHLYQLFPPTCPPSPSSPLSPMSPVPLSSPSSARLRVSSIQKLLESSFLHAGLKFVEAPSCLLLLTPRFGKDFKMFDAILPSLSLDITDLLDDTLRQCSICQAVAEWECLQCYEDEDITPGRLKQFCNTCSTQVHSHRRRASHSPLKVSVPEGAWPGPEGAWPGLQCARRRMSLFAVLSIETSHYVSFVKHGPLRSDWLFFDSMADRQGGQNGFNVPQVRACPQVGRYLSLSEEELSRVDPASLPEAPRRLLCDAYMCLYHSPELSLYK